MNAKERLDQVLAGEQIEDKLTVSLGEGPADIVVGHRIDDQNSCLNLQLIPGALAVTLEKNPEAFRLLEESPEEGESLILSALEDVQSRIEDCFSTGFDGFCYVVKGAYPEVSSPMQYGGHFLEVDRALLTGAEGLGYRMVLVEGDNEPYIDFVSDLPCELFAWDIRSGIDPSNVREMRVGGLVANHHDSDLDLKLNSDCLNAQAVRAL